MNRCVELLTEWAGASDKQTVRSAGQCHRADLIERQSDRLRLRRVVAAISSNLPPQSFFDFGRVSLRGFANLRMTLQADRFHTASALFLMRNMVDPGSPRVSRVFPGASTGFAQVFGGAPAICSIAVRSRDLQSERRKGEGQNRLRQRRNEEMVVWGAQIH